MPKQFKLREISESELKKLHQVSRSRVAAKREVERAQMVVSFHEGTRVEDIANQVGRTTATVYYQLHQFNHRGVDFLQDLARDGRPLTYDEMQRGEMVKQRRRNHNSLTYPSDTGHSIC